MQVHSCTPPPPCHGGTDSGTHGRVGANHAQAQSVAGDGCQRDLHGYARGGSHSTHQQRGGSPAMDDRMGGATATPGPRHADLSPLQHDHAVPALGLPLPEGTRSRRLGGTCLPAPGLVRSRRGVGAGGGANPAPAPPECTMGAETAQCGLHGSRLPTPAG